MTKIAIIGAGLSGLTVAHFLKKQADITIFEKSRGVGGRLSTRREDPYAFDHGAPFFKVRSSEFKSFINPMIEHGLVSPWIARFAEIKNRQMKLSPALDEENTPYVGVTGMNAVVKYLAQGLSIKLGVCVQSITRTQGTWVLEEDQGKGLGEYDWVVLAIPGVQASVLLPSTLACYSKITFNRMKGCFSLMLGFESPLPLAFDAANIHGEHICWIGVNNSKPGRQNAFSLMVHSTNSWAEEHMEDDRDQILNYLCTLTSDIIGCDLKGAHHRALHRWRYANCDKQGGQTHYIDPNETIGVCGDWCIQGRVEAAFTSGFDLAQSIRKELEARRRNG